MKRTLSTLALVTTALVANCSLAYANQSDCKANALHCAYVSGLNSGNLQDGRWMKISSTGGEFGVTCVNNTGTFEIYEDSSLKAGTQTWQFSLCKDASGNGCTLVGIDTFNITKNSNGTHSISPQYYNINAKSYAAQFPSCTATAPLHQQLHG